MAGPDVSKARGGVSRRSAARGTGPTIDLTQVKSPTQEKQLLYFTVGEREMTNRLLEVHLASDTDLY